MLQQTQASRVVPYYERWVAAFPTRRRAPRRGRRSAPGLGRSRLQRPCPAAPSGGRGMVRTTAAGCPTDRGAAGVAGRRSLHGPGGAGLRVRGPGGGGRHQLARVSQPLGRRAADGRRVPGTRAIGWSRRPLVGVQPDPVRHRRHGVPAGRPDCGRCPLPQPALVPLERGGVPRIAGPAPAPTGRSSPRAPQSAFAGSDRQGRGAGPRSATSRLAGEVAAAWGWPDDRDRAERLAADVDAEGWPGSTGQGRPSWAALDGPREAPAEAAASEEARIRRFTTSGARRWRKWPAPSTTAISELSARKASGDQSRRAKQLSSSRAGTAWGGHRQHRRRLLVGQRRHLRVGVTGRGSS